jgi:hypothetical protein
LRTSSRARIIVAAMPRSTGILFLGLGLVILGYGVYALFTGEVAVSRSGSGLTASRAHTPGLYWVTVLVAGLIGAFTTWIGWRAFRGRL